MQRSLRARFITLAAAWLMAGPAEVALAGPKAALEVAVVVGLEPEAFNVPTVELYRAVAEHLQASSAWRITSRGDVKARLAAGGATPAFAALAAIPAVDRGAVAAARKGAAKRRQKQGRTTRPAVIAPLQAMLDTLALDGAIVVDCKPSGTTAVTGCGVYYYDRALGRILAASEKSFRVEIADASLWAPTLVRSLDQGLQAYANKRERDRLDRVLAETSAEDAPDALAVELRALGLGLAEPRRRITAAPGAALRFGKQAKSYTTGLEVAYARATADTEAVGVALEDRAVGAFFTLESRALESMRWELDLGVAYALTAVRADDGELSTRSVRLRLGPGAMWELGRSLQCGLGLTYDRLVPLASSATGAFAGDTLGKNVLGFGVRLKTVF